MMEPILDASDRKRLKRRTQDDDGGNVIKDGEYLSTGMTFMDALQQSVVGGRPGFVSLDDNDTAQRLDSYQRYEDQLTNRWRGQDEPEDQPPPVNVNIYDAYDRRLSERWRGGA
jgi:hypothetical protein